MPTAARTYHYKLLFKYILIAGIIAGTLDAAAATLNYYIATGNGPVKIFIFIASGVLGKKAYTSSQSVAFLGLLFHYLIAIIFSAFYFWLYLKIKFFRKNIFFSAVLYGIFVWLIMNLLVVPLSNTPPLPFRVKGALIGLLILIICVGIPICVVAASFYKKNNSA